MPKKGEVMGLPVLTDTPLCSANLWVKFRVVSPMYRELQLGQINSYITFDISASGTQSLYLKKDLMVKLLVKINFTLVDGKCSLMILFRGGIFERS